VTVRAATSARLLAGFGIVGLGVLLALAADVAMDLLSPAKVAFALGGIVLLIPTMVVADPKAYWLFLLVLSIPFDISKWLSNPELTQTLVDTYGMPASGTVSLELYLTDVVLLAMLLPWLGRVCLRRERAYFPKIGYLFVFYLAWALLVSLINAQSFSLSIFELYREVLYFLCFVYLINNVTTPLQFRIAVWAVLLGLIIGAGTVIVFFEQGIGTDTVAFAGLHDQPATSPQSQTHKTKDSTKQNLTLHIGDTGLGRDRENGTDVKRSQGMFGHPAIPASLCGLTLPIVLAYLFAARRNRDRILFVMVYAWGFIALLLTFSRAGLIGLMVGTVVFFVVGAWSGLIARQLLKVSAVALTLMLVLSIPLMLIYLNTRPESFSMRFSLFEAALQGYWQHPIFGVGLNNDTAAMKAGKQESRDLGLALSAQESADSFYLARLTELGPVGLILFVVFFGKIVIIALRAMREVGMDMKPLLVGIVAGIASLATQNLADDPLAGHAISGNLWLFAALIIVIDRKKQADKELI
jgi:hypothetical protein